MQRGSWKSELRQPVHFHYVLIVLIYLASFLLTPYILRHWPGYNILYGCIAGIEICGSPLCNRPSVPWLNLIPSVDSFHCMLGRHLPQYCHIYTQVYLLGPYCWHLSGLLKFTQLVNLHSPRHPPNQSQLENGPYFFRLVAHATIRPVKSVINIKQFSLNFTKSTINKELLPQSCDTESLFKNANALRMQP